MKRKNILFFLAIIVLAIIFGSQRQGNESTQELVTKMDIDIDDQLRDFLERELHVWQAAAAAYESIGEEPDSSLYTLIAFNAKNIGDLGLSKEAYDAYFEYHTTNYAAYDSYGSLLRRMGDLEGAEDAYRKAISLNNDVEGYYHNLARVLTETGRDFEVEDLYKEAIKEIGQTRSLLIALAQWYEGQGECEDAISHYEVALQLAEDEGIAAAIEEDIAQAEESCE